MTKNGMNGFRNLRTRTPNPLTEKEPVIPYQCPRCGHTMAPSKGPDDYCYHCEDALIDERLQSAIDASLALRSFSGPAIASICGCSVSRAADLKTTDTLTESQETKLAAFWREHKKGK